MTSRRPGRTPGHCPQRASAAARRGVEVVPGPCPDRRVALGHCVAMDEVVAVIGAGNVGCALAADLAMRGVEVRLCTRSAARLAPLRAAGTLTVTGEVTG